MAKKFLTIVSFGAVVFALTSFTGLVSAGGPPSLPEEAGVYSVPGRPDLRLRVFVHGGHPEAEPARGQGNGKPAPNPTLSCGDAGVLDPDSSAVVALAGWRLPSSWTYQLNPSSAPATVGAANFATIAANGVGVWLSAIHNAVSMTRGADTSVNRAQFDSRNIVAFGRTSGNALATTYIWYNQSTGVAAEIDTIMNQKFTWFWSDPATWPTGQECAYQGVYDAQDILTHEFGHTFGLDDEYTSDFANNTMFGVGATGETKKNTLTTGDIAGVGALY